MVMVVVCPMPTKVCQAVVDLVATVMVDFEEDLEEDLEEGLEEGLEDDLEADLEDLEGSICLVRCGQVPNPNDLVPSRYVLVVLVLCDQVDRFCHDAMANLPHHVSEC